MVIRHAAISLKNSHALITIPNQEQGERDENLPDVRGPGGRDAALVPPVQRAAAGARVSPGPRVSPRSRLPDGPVRARPLPAGPLSARPVPTGPLSARPLSARPL